MDVDSIIRKVCEGFGLSPEQLASRSRKQNLVVARNTIFYLARKHTELSLQDIGDKFSRRHSTVLKGIASVERELRRESPLGRQIAGTLALLERRLGFLPPFPKGFDFIESLFAAFPVYPVGNFEKSVLFGTGSFLTA